MKLSRYRAIDLTVFAFIICILEVICVIAKVNFTSYFYLSLTSTLLMILIMRWNAWALIHAVLVGITYAITAIYINEDNAKLVTNLIVYSLGNCFIAFELLYIKIVKKERINSGGWYLVFYAIIGVFSVCLGRAVFSFILGDGFFSSLIRFLAVDSLNFVLAIVILFIANKQESMFYDQKNYFLEVRLGGKNEK